MTRLLLWLALSSFAASCSFANGQPVNWPAYTDCAPEVSDLVGTVSRILLGDGDADHRDIGDRAKDELTDLARAHGADTVACLVQQVVSDWTAPGAAQEPLRLSAAARGQDFLRDVHSVAHLQPEDTAAESSGGSW